MKKKEYRITYTVILVVCGDEFAILNRRPSEHGIFGVTLSFPPKPKMMDLFDNSGIVEILSYSDNGTFTFRRKPFYETHLMVDLLADLLEKHEQSQ